MKNYWLMLIFTISVIYSLILCFQLNIVSTPIGWILSFCLYLLFPGLIILHILKLDNWENGKKIAFGVCLGLAQLMIFSFFYNSYGYFLNKDFTLTSNLFNIIYSIYFILASLLILIILRKRKVYINLSLQTKYLYYSLFAILPIISYFGVIILNNNGTNLVSIILLMFIVLILIVISIYESKIPDSIFPIIIFMISLSLLWMYSMRSSYIVGWDIHQEFKVFQITKEIGLWDISNYRSAYNATISITILPTIIANITKIQDIYVYKLIYPILFSFTPVLVYYIAKTHIRSYFAFLASFFFMSQFQFMTQMPALNRQAIAFIFFGLLIYSLFSKSLSTVNRNILIIISSIIIIVSHYTSAYITAGLLLSIYLCSILYSLLHYILKNILSLKMLLKLPRLSSTISLWMVIFFCVFTYVWYGLYTKITNDLETLGQKLYTNISKIHDDELKSEQARYAIWGSSNKNSLITVGVYSEEIRRVFDNSRQWAAPYLNSEFEKYPIVTKSAKIVPVKNKSIKNISDFIIETSKKIIKVLILVGAIYLLSTVIYNNRKEYSLDLITLSLTGLTLLTVLAVVPFFSIYYNFERLYQQGLFVLGIALIIGVLFVTNFKEKLSKILLTSLLAIYFIYYSGLFAQYLGGTPSLSLNNYGEEYDRFYTHPSELLSAKWLSKYAYPNASISTDRYGWLRFQSYTRRDDGFLTEVVSTVIPKYGYIYSSYANTYTGIARTNYKSQSIEYNFPKEFLEDNKNLIYSSKTSVIYK